MLSILPGRPQSTRQALCTVNWDGLRLVAYISGNNAIVFNGRRDILAYLSVDEVEFLHALSIDEESGNIALCDESKVFVYTPSGRDYGDLRWTRMYDLDCAAVHPVRSLSWGSSDELLVAGHALTLWNLANHDQPQVMWSSTLSSPIHIASFSPDAGLIASCGEHDRMVKIWRRLSYEQDTTRFDVSYLLHPAAITDMYWRKVWHHEQTLDNLLYTCCADKQIRVWSNSDHHSPAIMQMVSSIDAKESIQPRRLSMGSVCKDRFAFVIHSRDLSRAAERALQTSRQTTGHALEHLIQIANRSPEICVVLDGRGHMSAWGLENAGYRNKHSPEKFNVALVDGVDITLPSTTLLEDLVQIQAFANNDASASLCILVHSYSGQIDWYQGSFTEFFDTAARHNRVLMHSSWSGHASGIEKVVASPDCTCFISWTHTNRAIVWSQSATGALIRQSRLKVEGEILDIVLLNKQNAAILLLNDSLEVWDIQVLTARRIRQIDLDNEDYQKLVLLSNSNSKSRDVVVGVVFENLGVHIYDVSLSSQSSTNTNGYHKESGRPNTTLHQKIEDASKRSTIQCAAFTTTSGGIQRLDIDRDGQMSMYDILRRDKSSISTFVRTLHTWVRPSQILSASRRFAALVHEDRHTLSIWNTRCHFYEFVYTFNERDEIHSLHWYEVHGGLNFLAIHSLYTVFILSQYRYSSEEESKPWTFHKPVRVREHSSNAIGSVCWIDDCRLVISAGDQILVFDVSTGGSQQDVNQARSVRSPDLKLLQKLALSNTTLPIFHPTVVSSLLWGGHIFAVHTVFQELRRELRFTIEGDIVPSDLNLNAAELLRDISHTNRSSNSELDAEGIVQLQGACHKISRKQALASQIRQLLRLIDVYAQVRENQTSMDKFALAYLQDFLLSIPDGQSEDGQLQALPFRAIVAATLSETQEALVHFVMTHLDSHRIKLTWSTARCLGLFLFLKPPTSDDQSLQMHLETVARNEYNRDIDDRNPVNCSLYYLALNRKNILQSLWRTTVGIKEKENTMRLLAHDFTQQKWKATALKNAYALLSRRRFEYAAAFFLLGGSVSDACNICVNQLRDIQLAVAVARVWSDAEAGEQVLHGLTERSILDIAVESQEARWMAIWGPIYRKDYKQATRIIVRQADELFHDRFSAKRQDESQEQLANEPFQSSGWQANDPKGLVEIYLHLRSELFDTGQWKMDVVTPGQEWEFVMRCVQWYLRSGMDHLALALVANWHFITWQDAMPSETIEAAVQSAKKMPVKQEPASILDAWGDDSAIRVKKKDHSQEKGGGGKVGPVESKAKPPPTQFVEPSASSLLDSFGF